VIVTEDELISTSSPAEPSTSAVRGGASLVPQQATFAPVGVARPLRFGFMELAAGPPSHWIVTLAGGFQVYVWADAVTGLAEKAPLLLLPADPLRQPSATGQLCGGVNRSGPPADQGACWAASNRCRRGHVA